MTSSVWDSRTQEEEVFEVGTRPPAWQRLGDIEGGRKRRRGLPEALSLPLETPAKGVRSLVSKGSVCEHALRSTHVWDQGSDHDQGQSSVSAQDVDSA